MGGDYIEPLSTDEIFGMLDNLLEWVGLRYNF